MRQPNHTRRWILSLCLGSVLLGTILKTNAAPYHVGSKLCQECHKSEHEVWEKTKHAESFRDLHRNEKGKEILAAVGGDKNIRKNKTCTQCHYTLEQADESATPTAKTSISCESCHGPASDWLKLHNDYGAGASKESESAAHKTKRLADSVLAGMIRPEARYEVAANCLSCHNLQNVEKGALAKMLEAGHPINPKFELVRYSQGSVRHRFYPPDVSVNAEMKPAELARWMVIGAAAKLVAATQALPKSDQADFKAAQQQLIKDAMEILSAVRSVPEVAALVTAPTEENARKLVAALEGKDVSSEVQSLLPKAGDFK
jgi:hypothetical protein